VILKNIFTSYSNEQSPVLFTPFHLKIEGLFLPFNLVLILVIQGLNVKIMNASHNPLPSLRHNYDKIYYDELFIGKNS